MDATASGLTEFLNARLDEEERLADAANSAGMGVDIIPGFTGPLAVHDHIATWSPARARLEDAADRALLAAWEAAEANRPHDDAEYAHGYAAGLADGLLLAVKHRAARFSGHPAYRRVWKP